MTAAALSVETVTENNSSDSLLQSSVLLPEPASLTLSLFLTNMSLQSAPVGPLSHIWESPDWCVRQCQLLSAENTQTRQFLVQERCQISLVEQQTVICAKTLWSCEETAKWHCFISAAALRETGCLTTTTHLMLSSQTRPGRTETALQVLLKHMMIPRICSHDTFMSWLSRQEAVVELQTRDQSVNVSRRREFSSRVRGDRSIFSKTWCF